MANNKKLKTILALSMIVLLLLSNITYADKTDTTSNTIFYHCISLYAYISMRIWGCE